MYYKLKQIYPDLDVGPDGLVLLIDRGDGNGVVVERWADPRPVPSADELAAVADAAATAEARASIPPVTRRQMLTALHRSGLLAMIKGAVSASGDIEMQIAFDESQEFQRDNPFLASMAQALGKTDAEVDAIFALAASL